MKAGLAMAGLLVGLAATAGMLRAGSRQQQDPLAEPFRGVSVNGTVRPGLFPIRATGVSTAPIRTAADAFLAGLSPEQRTQAKFPVDGDQWRRWNNVHRAVREGVSFEEMNEAQRTRAIELLRASLSAKGLKQTRDIMRLNGHLADLLNRHGEYGEYLYWIAIMGEPSTNEPWGWQLEGHHLIINYFVLGDQVVMTPTFMGSEPVSADSGRYAGTRVLEAEERKGLALMNALSTEQRARATIETAKTQNNALAQAYRDNLVLDYAGIPATALNPRQRELLLDLIGEHVGNMRDAHARVRMSEVRQHLDSTYFAWIGNYDQNAVFYYRVQSPVILIEFDHQTPVALPVPRGVPTRAHVHSVVRTPNGNDYGKDLLRQHYERARSDSSHGH